MISFFFLFLIWNTGGCCPRIPPQKGEMIFPSCPHNFKKSVRLPITCNCKYLINRLCSFIFTSVPKIKANAYSPYQLKIQKTNFHIQLILHSLINVKIIFTFTYPLHIILLRECKNVSQIWKLNIRYYLQ